MALHHACGALEARPPQVLRGSVAVSMLHQLAVLHMHPTILRWTRVLAQTHVPDMDPHALTGIVQQLCREKMYAEAYAFVQTLPVAWRTPGMYPALVGHYAHAMLDLNGHVNTPLQTPDTRLWHELCTVAHLAPPGPLAYLARLASHAKKARALHALRDERLVRHMFQDDAKTRAAACLYTLRALMHAGRWSLAVRYARRCLRRDGPPSKATAWLNTLVAGLVLMQRTRTATPEQRRHLLSYLYRAVLRPVPVHSARRLPYMTSHSETLDPLVDAISQLIPALHARPNPPSMSSFKVRLRVPPNGGSKSPSDSTEGAPVTMEPPSEAASERSTPVPQEPGTPTQADAGRQPSVDSAVEMQRGSSNDPPQSETPQTQSPAPESKPGKKAAKSRRSLMPNSISAVAASLTLEELDALPSAKRRKSLKTRGAPGPGRGWRKGLSKGQKPVYRLPDMDLSTADVRHDPDKMPVQATTPSSFASSSSSSRKAKSSSSASKSIESVPLVSATIRVLPNSADAVFKYPPMPSLKDAPALLPLPRIPNVIPTVAPLQKSDLKPRHWQHGQREILNIAGRSWRAPAWLTEEKAASLTTETNEPDESNDATADTSVAPSETDADGKA
ncbi:hypothetical protein MBRA1_002041 [Malassezia brasiliensis]|uniref:Uncharacterized protein n=1 Tax=Malassezia brasiliensis TaxID=1821822 RepID=A0AAF0DTX7_9BASI|nr:hypothetical protein MBRA1_002041 [Malassezia brasiliensis]